ncbi:hypothetical protein V7O62_03225 [Methanolobus sp. ZRKC2]|uniref:hypothetical protein n=1 Tax=Methanolobus sp. ZRKC2 TaxID=3125783 RepID=UPI0032441EE8
MLRKFLLSFLLFVILTPCSSAYEEINIEYHQADIGDVNRYWYGQGELSVLDTGKTFTLHTNGNDIVSYTTNAGLTDLTEEEMEFSSTYKQNYLTALFLSQKPSGHGVFTLELDVPYVSGNSSKHVTLAIENAERVIYLNGPVYFEKTDIRSEENYKIIEIENPENGVKIIFITKLAYGILTGFAGISLFGLSLLVLLLLRRKVVLKTMKEKVPYYLEKIPVTIREEEGIEVRLTRKQLSSLKRYLPSVKKELETDNEGKTYNTISFRIPRELFALVFILMLLFIMLAFVLNMLSGYAEQMGVFVYVNLGMIAAVGLMMTILLISVEDKSDLNSIIALFIGGFILVLFSRVGLIVIPMSVIATVFVYGFNRAVLKNKNKGTIDENTRL